MRGNTLLVAFALMFSAPTMLHAAEGPIQHLPALNGDYFEINSKTADHRYHIFISYPPSYAAEPERKFPVVYVLDGDSLFPLLASEQLFLGYDEKLPEAIIVGIAYGSFDEPVNRRGYDFSPATPDAHEGQGGAPAFLRFMQGELIPQVEARVRADPTHRVLLGQSRSGYFSLWSAYADPDLFWGRIASNPAVVPGKELLLAPPLAPPSRHDLGVVLVSGTRDDSQVRRDGAHEWQARWEHAADAPWQGKLIELEGGTHAASIGEAYRQAMLWLWSRERK